MARTNRKQTTATDDAVHTCGDAGGTTASGNPCGRRTEVGERCSQHATDTTPAATPKPKQADDATTALAAIGDTFATAVATPSGDDPSTPDADALAAVLDAATAIGNHGGRVTNATNDAFATAVQVAVTDPDPASVLARATATRDAVASALASKRSGSSTPATVDHAAIVAARVQALATLAAMVAADADARGVDTTDADALADVHGVSADTDALAEAWRRAFGGRVPDVERTPGHGGNRRSFGRSLADVPDGPVTWTHRGTEHTANVSGEAIVTADGVEHAAPSTACAHVATTDDGSKVSVNGWDAWQRDGVPLRAIVDAQNV